LPDPYYPDYPSGPALAGADIGLVPLHAPDWAPDLEAAPRAAALYLNYPSNPVCGVRAAGTFGRPFAGRSGTGGAVVHDAAYIDLVYDGRDAGELPGGRRPQKDRCRNVVDSKTYGMAGWRVGFVWHAEIVERINLLNDHNRVGIFRPVQAGNGAAAHGTAGLRLRARPTPTRGAATCSRKRCPSRSFCEGTFYVWLRLPGGLTAESLLARAHASAVAPGEALARAAAGWARLSLAVT